MATAASEGNACRATGNQEVLPILAFCCKIVEIQHEADGSFSQARLRALCF